MSTTIAAARDGSNENASGRASTLTVLGMDPEPPRYIPLASRFALTHVA
jgi:hypothetical protein